MQNNHFLKLPLLGGHPKENTLTFHIYFIQKSPSWLQNQTASAVQPTAISTATLPTLLIGLLMGLMLNIMGSSEHSHTAHPEIRTFNPQGCSVQPANESPLSCTIKQNHSFNVSSVNGGLPPPFQRIICKFTFQVP